MDPFHHLLSSNESLHPSQVAFVKKEIDARIEAIRNMEVELSKYQALLSPLRQFPAEILGEVFAAVIDTVEKPIEIPNALSNLSLVSKAWRNAALSTPRLWGTVGVNLTRPGVDFTKVGAWFARSGTTPRSFTLESGGACRDHGSGCLLLNNSGLPDFLKDGPSINRLTISSWSSECFQWLFCNLFSTRNDESSAWKSIQSIELNSYRLGIAPPVVGMQDLQDPCAHPLTVTTLNLDGPFSEGDVHAVNQSAYVQQLVSNLTNLSFTFVWPTTWNFGILSLCTNLQTLKLKMDFDDAWLSEFWEGETLGNLQGAPLNFPNLRTLQISDLPVDTKWYSQVLRLFKTPSLVELDLEFDNDASRLDRYELAQDINYLVMRSKCKPTFSHLRLCSISFTNEGLEYLLKNLPSLTHLTLDWVNFSSDFFHRPMVVNYYFLPRLRTLELLHLYEMFVYTDLYQFVEARTGRYSSTFQKLSVEVTSDWIKHPNESFEVKCLRKRGLDIQFNVGRHLG
ncbi:hypothetical protein NMY22_g13133 [Coprinellus aureogranulatus]|nr:hypothetical protein NMY22_g13133 [Coprinellus aureogranulatus]